MSEVLIQIQDFCLTLILGILAGFIFHYYQLTITKAKLSRYPLYILDFFLWIIMICLVFFAMLWINQGEMRLYVLIALIMGVLIYYHYFSPYLRRTLEFMAEVTTKMGRFLVKGGKLPISWLKGFFCPKAPPPDDEI